MSPLVFFLSCFLCANFLPPSSLTCCCICRSPPLLLWFPLLLPSTLHNSLRSLFNNSISSLAVAALWNDHHCCVTVQLVVTCFFQMKFVEATATDQTFTWRIYNRVLLVLAGRISCLPALLHWSMQPVDASPKDLSTGWENQVQRYHNPEGFFRFTDETGFAGFSNRRCQFWWFGFSLSGWNFKTAKIEVLMHTQNTYLLICAW